MHMVMRWGNVVPQDLHEVGYRRQHDLREDLIGWAEDSPKMKATAPPPLQSHEGFQQTL